MTQPIRSRAWCPSVWAGFLAFISPVVAQQAPKISLKAVEVTGVCLGGEQTGHPCVSAADCDGASCGGVLDPALNQVVAAPGSTLRVDVFLSEWSPNGEGLRGYQVELDAASRASGFHGRLLCSNAGRSCNDHLDCLDLGTLCVDGRCGSTGGKADGAWIDETRPDWVFYSPVPPRVVFIDEGIYLPCVLGASLLDPSDAPTYEPRPQQIYAGTFQLDVSTDACGEFTVTVDDLGTHLVDPLGNRIEPVYFERLVVDVSAAPCPPILAASPPDGVIDARQPSEPDGSQVHGWETVALRFPDAANAAQAADVTRFSAERICEPPATPVDLSYAVVSEIDPEWVEVGFVEPIVPDDWTCVTYLPNGDETCLGFLPGDVNGDRSTTQGDLETLIGCLHGERRCAAHQCDIDRSGRCGPADILRLVDLLNGGDQYDTWDGRSLAECGP